MHQGALLGAALAAAVRAAQPGALKPVHAPLRDLTWGQLNFLHTTDTHGWLAGHLLEYESMLLSRTAHRDWSTDFAA